jgi:hypothetical protein
LLRIKPSIHRFDLKLKNEKIPYRLIGKHHRFAIKVKYLSKVLRLRKFIKEILVQHIPHSPMKKLDLFFVNKSSFLKIAGIYISEGFGRRYETAISVFDKKLEKEISKELNKMKIKHKFNGRSISLYGPLAYVLLKQFGNNSTNKRLPSWIFDLDVEDKKLLLEWMYRGDGHKKTTKYSTVSKKLFKQLIKLLVEVGFIPRYYDNEKTKTGKTVYRIVWQRNYSTFSWKDNISKKWYKGKIYCVSVKDNHTILAGSDGKFQFIGQSYGKYHFTGHRKCNISLHPKDSKKFNNICPKCGKKFTVGVLQRVEELADRPEGFIPKNAIPFKRLLPLYEIISFVMGSGELYSKKVLRENYKLVEKFGNELNVLLNVPKEDLLKVTNEKVAEAIIKVREGKISFIPGYDGVYGKPVFNEKDLRRANRIQQKSLREF